MKLSYSEPKCVTLRHYVEVDLIHASRGYIGDCIRRRINGMGKPWIAHH